jgi:hypothetical protein
VFKFLVVVAAVVAMVIDGCDGHGDANRQFFRWWQWWWWWCAMVEVRLLVKFLVVVMVAMMMPIVKF